MPRARSEEAPDREMGECGSLRDRVIAAGVWFVDIPRTSSSSIRVDLARRCGEVYAKKTCLVQPAARRSSEVICRHGCVDYLTDDQSHSLVKQTIRYEEREAALECLGRELGCADLGWQVVQEASPAILDGTASFDSETAAIIGERYRADVETYGYSPAAA
jgi:hypothetical protein